MIAHEFIRNGKDRTMVFVHGFTQDRRIFAAQVSAFSAHFDVLLIDLRGHGESSHHDGPFGIEEYTDDVQAIFDRYGLNGLVYWGTHTGTAIGIALCLRDKRYIAALVLEGTVIPGFSTPDINRNIARARKAIAEKGLDFAISDWLDHAEWFEYMRTHPLAARFDEHKQIIRAFTGKPWQANTPARTPKDVTQALGEISAKALVYNGEYDMPEFLEMAHFFATRTRSRWCAVPEAGAFPLWENPAGINQLVREWLIETGLIPTNNKR